MATLQQKKAISPGLLQALPSCVNGRDFSSLAACGQGRAAFANREEFLEKNGNDYESIMQSLVRVFSDSSCCAKAR